MYQKNTLLVVWPHKSLMVYQVRQLGELATSALTLSDSKEKRTDVDDMKIIDRKKDAEEGCYWLVYIPQKRMLGKKILERKV